jgi:hypothetical protein
MGEDEVTQLTAKDCLRNKYLTAMKGYITSPRDPFLPLMTNFILKNQDMVSSMPIIRRGYFARMASQKMVLDQFLGANATATGATQILCLGCGYDTELWSLTLSSQGKISLFEVDFPIVVHKKKEFCRTLQATKNNPATRKIETSDNSIVTNVAFDDPNCPIHFVPCDLRDDVNLIVDNLVNAGLLYL